MERPSFWRLPRDFQPPGKRCSPHVWQPPSMSNSTSQQYSREKVMYGSPAHEGGLKSGDVIMGIGSTPTNNPTITHQKATDMVKKSGNTLNLSVYRSNSNAPKSPTSSSNFFMPVATSKGIIPNFDTHNVSLPSDQERIIYEQEKKKERQAVVNQPHRTFPMVQPKPKPIHDYPVGSYLKYMKDPNWQTSPKSATPPPQSEKLKEVMTRLATNMDHEKVVHLQYNSPINVYSQENIAETLMPQTMKRNAASDQSAPPLVRPVTPLTNIRHSPTYQLVQEQEQTKHYGPAKDRLYSPISHNVSGIDGHEFPAQSHSFNTLMTSLLQHPKC